MTSKKLGTNRVAAALTLVAALTCGANAVRAQGVDFRQAANKDPVVGDIDWRNSILQANNSVYYEGVSVPQRLIFVNIPATTGDVHTLTFNHQSTKSDVHAYDYLTSWQQAVDSANAIAPGQDILINLFTDACEPAIGPQASTAICNALRGGANVMMVDVPDIMGMLLGDDIDASIAAYESAFGNRQIKIYGDAPISAASLVFNGHAAGLEAPDVDANYTLSWTSASTQILIEMAGHLSVGPDNGGGVGIGYGPGLGASAISGGPYHFRIVQLDGASLGQQDNQIKGADIILPFCVPGACDDGVVCTIDECDEITDTCTHTASSGECDDGLFCTGTATCDPVNGCEPDGAPNCDDGNPCTIDSCNEDTDQCDNIPDDSFCDDGNYCNGTETCDAIAGCVAGTPPNCNDGVNCTIDSCDEVNDVCVNAPDDGVCSDGAYCNGDETCDPLNGCEAGTPPNCGDGVGCTVDSCDEVNDTCVNTPVDGNCDDGQFCNGVETCDPVLGCQAGTAPNCDDGNPCTVDSCNETTDACINTPMNSLCSDGLFCNGAEVCDPINGCQAGTPPNCDDSVSCTDDSCDEANDTCVNTPSDGNCDDGAYCNGAETCDPVNDCQAGTPSNCNDGVACTNDSCDEATDSCVNVPDDGNCDDSAYCNGAETCDPLNGCEAGSPPNCGDGVVCTVDSCNEATDSCDNVPNDAACDDGLYCTGVEVCDPVNGCEAGTPIDCDDGVSCTVDACDDNIDDCVNTPDDSLCSNGLFCDGDETCDPVGDCQPGTPVVCDDLVDCTDDSCDELNDECDYVPDDGSCDDGLFCNGMETCDPIVGCLPGMDPCTGDLLCDEVNDECVNCLDDIDCDDGLYCNGAETCDPTGVCVPGAAPVCDDGVSCTVDSCNEATDSCDNVANNSICNDGAFCNGVEVCDPVNDCQAGAAPNCDDGVSCTVDSCNEATDSCDNVADDSICNDGAFCNGVEVCDPVNDCQAGAAPNCDDGVSCTIDSCNEATDSCDNISTDSLCDNGLFCDGAEVCDPLNDCQPGTPVNCGDGVGCTVDSCDETADACVNSPDDAACSDGAFCNGAETCDPLLGCQAGTPPVCDDGVACTADSCNEMTDSCDFTPSNALCNDGQFCNGVEFCDPLNDCQAGTPVDCDDGVSCTVDSCNEQTDSCDNLADDAVCNDGAFCNGVETCDPLNDCQAGLPPNCNDGVNCTVDSCNEDTDSCENDPSDAVCDDGAFCNGVETCDPLNGCQAGTPVACGDGVGCTDDRCDEDTDMCVNDPNDANCDDGAFCNGDETCDPLQGCQAGTAPNCNDGVGCTSDVCDDDIDSCVNNPSDAACDDGAFCNGMETCDPVNDCQAGTPVDCDDAVECTVDSCSEAKDLCLNTPDDSLCTDGAFCNGVEVCDPELDCQPGAPVDCDDGVSCTDDSCDEDRDECVSTPDDANCDDGAFCNGVEFCDPEGDCQAGTAPDCDDGIDCTIDACDEVIDSCVIEPSDAFCNDGDPCTIDTCTGIGCGHEFICGACCVDDTCSDKLTLADCEAQGGTFGGNGSGCLGDNDGDGRDDACVFVVIPTVSQWGLAALTLLLLIAAKVAFRVRPETV